MNGRVSPEVIQRLSAGVELDDGPAKFDKIVAEAESDTANQWFRVTLKEGRNRMVRRLWESQDLQVSRLIRTRFGPVPLPRWLARGKIQELDAKQIEAIAQAAKLEARPAPKLRVIPVHPRHRRKAQQRSKSR